MAIDTLTKEAEGLSEEALQKVYEYIQFLKYMMNHSDRQNMSEKTVKRTPGGLEGTLSMADDFDETPDCFKEYL